MSRLVPIPLFLAVVLVAACLNWAVDEPSDGDADVDSDVDADADADADDDDDPCDGVTCSGHGRCFSDEDEAVCICDEHYRADGLACVPASADGDADADSDEDYDVDEDGDNCIALAEECDGVDNDCDGEIDEGVMNLYYRDQDSDGYGNIMSPRFDCDAPAGYVENSTDCDDGNGAIRPEATETCDGVDNDCDGSIDAGCTCVLGSEQQCGLGEDEGECAWGTQGCIDDGGGSGPVWGDCEGGRRPAEEACDGLDNDCSGEADEPIPCTASCGDGFVVCLDGERWSGCRCS